MTPPDVIIPACSDNKSRDCDESKNKGGDGVCDTSKDCKSGRYCTP